LETGVLAARRLGRCRASGKHPGRDRQCRARVRGRRRVLVGRFEAEIAGWPAVVLREGTVVPGVRVVG
jgi:hypothetical protein